MSATTANPVPFYLDLDSAITQVGDLPSALGILVMVEETLRHDIPQISAYLADDNVPDAGRLLHSLKGFLPIFCRPALCERVTRLEALSKLGHSAEVRPAFDTLEPELVQLQREISDCLKQQNSPT